MTLDEIFEQWEGDAQVDRLQLGVASLNIPKLHHKYWRILSSERLILKKYESDLAALMVDKKSWLSGEMTSDELKERGWNVHLKKMLKTEQEEFLRADGDVVQLRLKIALQSEKVEVLTDIIKSIHNRSFIIGNAIKFAVFQTGG